MTIAFFFHYSAYVSFGEKNRQLGAAAKQQVISNLKNTVWSWKKLIGRKFSDPIVQREQQFVPYKLVERQDGGVGIQVGEVRIVDPQRVKLFRGNKNINLYFMSFLHIDMTQLVEILPQVRQGPTYLFYIVNIMVADVLATKGARASATMILT